MEYLPLSAKTQAASGQEFYLFCSMLYTWHLGESPEHWMYFEHIFVKLHILIRENLHWCNDVRWWYPLRFFRLLSYSPIPIQVISLPFPMASRHLLHLLLNAHRLWNLKSASSLLPPWTGLSNFVPNLKRYGLTLDRANPFTTLMVHA